MASFGFKMLPLIKLVCRGRKQFPTSLFQADTEYIFFVVCVFANLKLFEESYREIKVKRLERF